MAYRFVTPVPRKTATGLVAAVYAQSARDLGADFGPHLSPAPHLHAAAWAALRESQLVGLSPRAAKEAAAAAVAVANECPFCVDAHTAMLHGTGAHRLAEAVARGETPPDPADAALVRWAGASRTPGSVPAPPFPAEYAAEFVGTVLVNHFINRMVDALRPGRLLPGGGWRAAVLRRLAGLAVRRAVRRRLRPGDSLPLLAGLPSEEPAWWAEGSPSGTAFAVLRATASTGAALLSPAATSAVRNWAYAWDGTHPPLSGGWLAAPLADLPEADRPGVRLALLAAAAPYRITEADVAAWRGDHSDGDRGDGELVLLLAFGAMCAVDRIEEGITESWLAAGRR